MKYFLTYQDNDLNYGIVDYIILFLIFRKYIVRETLTVKKDNENEFKSANILI